MKIYYAHHLWKYNTLIEEYEINLIREAFPTASIVNPNTDIAQGRDEAKIMLDCIETVKQCDAIVFSSINGAVGKGVVDEVSNAESAFYIQNNAITQFNGTFEIIPDSTTKRVYAIVKT